MTGWARCFWNTCIFPHCSPPPPRSPACSLSPRLLPSLCKSEPLSSLFQVIHVYWQHFRKKYIYTAVISPLTGQDAAFSRPDHGEDVLKMRINVHLQVRTSQPAGRGHLCWPANMIYFLRLFHKHSLEAPWLVKIWSHAGRESSVFRPHIFPRRKPLARLPQCALWVCTQSASGFSSLPARVRLWVSFLWISSDNFPISCTDPGIQPSVSLALSNCGWIHIETHFYLGATVVNFLSTREIV